MCTDGLACAPLQTAAVSETSAQHNYAARRAAIRHTWLPDCQAQERAECRFVIGLVDVRGSAESLPELHRELNTHNDILKLPLDDSYRALPRKSLLFFRHVGRHYNARYIVKVDDDVYLQVPRLMAAVQQWSSYEVGAI